MHDIVNAVIENYFLYNTYNNYMLYYAIVLGLNHVAIGY